MPVTIAAMLPVVMLIGLGSALRRSGVIPAAAWPPIERLTYLVLFPSLLFVEVAGAELRGQPVAAMALVLIASLLVMTGLTAAVRWLRPMPGPAYTSMLQGSIRWNSFTALALAGPVLGPAAPPLVALAIAVMVPTANLISVLALLRHGASGPAAGGAGASALGVLRALITNPLIVSCLAGAVWNAAGPALPEPLAETLRILGRASLAVGLLAVGAGLQLAVVGTAPALVAMAVVAKLLIHPLVVIGLAAALGIGGTALGVAVLATSMPAASSSYVLARLMGGDAGLMAAILTVQTVAAALTVPLILALL